MRLRQLGTVSALPVAARNRERRRPGTVAVLAVGGAVALTAAVAPGAISSAATVRTAEANGVVAVDVAGRAGVASDSVRTWSAASVDFNLDGTQDVLIGHHGNAAKLYRNPGGGQYQLVETTLLPAGVSDRHNCAWADVDRNGRPDVYCSAGRGKRNYVKRGRDNELWLQRRNGTFWEAGTEWRVGDPCGRGRSVTFINANGDRFPDLFVGNAQPRQDSDDPCDWSTSLPNERSKLFINIRGERFRYMPRLWNYGSGPGSRCAVVVDFNRDGWEDLFTCSGGNPRLYVNRAGRGLVNVTGRHRLDWKVTDAVMADIDRDRDPDLITSTLGGFGYHLNNAGRFGARRTIWNAPQGEGRAVAAGDADGDGDIDVYGMVGSRGTGNPDDWIWLNNRLSFTSLQVPSAGGSADDVVALRPLGTRRAFFLALNGVQLSVPGPVQLIKVRTR